MQLHANLSGSFWNPNLKCTPSDKLCISDPVFAAFLGDYTRAVIE